MAWLYADGLVGVGPSGPLGLLAERLPNKRDGSIASDGKSLTYTLRPNVRWHDGRPFLASDVVEAFHRLRPDTWRSYRPYSLVRSIEARGTRTVRVALKEADPLFVLGFFSAYGDPNLPLVRDSNLPIGTGPYAVRSYSSATGNYTLRSWAWSPRSAPVSTEMTYRFVPDQNTEAAGLVAGEYDAALFAPHAFVEGRGLRTARYTAGAVVLFANTTGALSSLALRRLVMSSIDREDIRTKIFGNWGMPADTLVSPGLGGRFRFPAQRPDAEALRQAIQRLRPSGISLTFAGLPGLGDRIGLLLQAQLSAVGVDLRVKSFSPQEYFAENGPLHTGLFDLALDGMSYSRDPDLEATFSCTSATAPGLNYSRFCDAGLDRALAQENFDEATRILHDRAVVLPISQIVSCMGLGPNVRNFHVQNYVPVTYFCNQWALT